MSSYSILIVAVSCLITLVHCGAIQGSEKIGRQEKQALEVASCFPQTLHDGSGIENVHWLNEIVSQAWPHLEAITLQVAREKIQPLAQQAFHANALLQGFSFKSIELGSESIKIDGVRVHKLHKEMNGKIVMDLDIAYKGDAELKVSFIGISGGVNGIVLNGRLRVELYLMDWLPLFGGTVVYFTEKPLVNFNLHGWANIGDFPGLGKKLRDPIDYMIQSNLVFPNKILMISQQGDSRLKIPKSKMLMPSPTGVLRVIIIRAKNLLKKEFFNFSPYCVLTLGSISTRTTQKSGVNPNWHEVFEFPLEIPEGLKINLEMFEQDIFTKDDSLGRNFIDIGDVIKKGRKEEWVDLIGVGQGKLLVESIWMETSTIPPMIDAAMIARVLLSVYVGSVNISDYSRSGVKKLKVVTTMDGETAMSKDVEVTKGMAAVEEGFSLIGDGDGKVVINVIEVGTGKKISQTNVDIDRLRRSENLELLTVNDSWLELCLRLRYIVPTNV